MNEEKKLSPMEQTEVRSRARGLSPEEIKLFLQEIPSVYLHKELYDRDMAAERRNIAHEKIATMDFREKCIVVKNKDFKEEQFPFG